MPNQKFFPPPDGRKVYAKIRTSDGAILSRAAHWPASVDDEPLVGDDGSILFLPVLEDPEPVEYDSDLFSVEITEVVGLTHFLIARSLVKRSPAELKLRARNYEGLHRSAHLPPTEFSATAARALAVVVKLAKNLNPTPEDTAALEDFLGIQSKLEANQARLAEIEAQIDLGEEPDLKTGWEVKNP